MFTRTGDLAEVRLATSVWLSLLQSRPDHFDLKTTFTILTALRNVHFFGSDSPLFSDGRLPSTDLHHPNEKMCKAMHAYISKQSLAAYRYLHDDSCDELPDALLRVLTLIATNIAYGHDVFDGQVSQPLEGISTEDTFGALDVTLDCLLQIVANERAQDIDTTWSNTQKDVLATLTTTPLFEIRETDLRIILPPVKRRVFLKTMSLIGLVYKPADPLPAATVPFRSAMMKLLLQVYVHVPYVEGQPWHEYEDSIALLFSVYDRGDNPAHKALRKDNLIPILCNDVLKERGHMGDLTFSRWNTKYHQRPERSLTLEKLEHRLFWSNQLLDRYLAHIPTDQERASGRGPTTVPSSDFDQDIEYLFSSSS